MPEGREKGTLVQPGAEYTDARGRKRRGQPIEHPIYARRRNQVGTEGVAGFEFVATAPTVFYVREQKSIAAASPAWAYRDRTGRLYDIVSVRPTAGRRRELEILTTGRVS